MKITYEIYHCGTNGSPGNGGSMGPSMIPLEYWETVEMCKKLKLPAPHMPVFESEESAIEGYDTYRKEYEKIRAEYNKGSGKGIFGYAPNWHSLPTDIFIAKIISYEKV